MQDKTTKLILLGSYKHDDLDAEIRMLREANEFLLYQIIIAKWESLQLDTKSKGQSAC